MVDFLIGAIRKRKNNNSLEVYPEFRLYPKSNDLMIRGGDFYAIWNEDTNYWSTDEDIALALIDRGLEEYKNSYLDSHKELTDKDITIAYMWDAGNGNIDSWHRYCQKQKRDSFHMLDENLSFFSDERKREDYLTKSLPYSLCSNACPSYTKLISTLYDEEEKHKLEWAIGSIVTGDSKKIQKFIVLYGSAGTGKSTILNIIQQLFEGYYAMFDAKILGASNNSFPLEAFKTNPLIAIQHDGDLSKIEDNTVLNSLVSHETMTVNEKYKSTYSNRFKSFLFMGTNKPVKITDAKSGLMRRLIDVTPSGNKLPSEEYEYLTEQIKFELGSIANHCKEVYLADPHRYDKYVPLNMMSASNDFYNFVSDSYYVFKREDGVSLKIAWEMYKAYCDEAKVQYPFSKRIFKEELKNYFKNFDDRLGVSNEERSRNYYSGFKHDIFDEVDTKPEPAKKIDGIEFAEQPSVFDEICKDCLAQYASTNQTPSKKWDSVKTHLNEINTKKIHYVKIPENHIVIDFDIKDDTGKKSLVKNLEEANKWPPTYAELSKSGQGIHLHYIFNGDVNQLSRVYADNIEIKVFTGKSSLRRKLTKCNNLPINTISSGLPLKGEKKMVNANVIQSEKGLRKMVERNMDKEFHPGTKPSVDFIYKILEDAYEGGVHYDLTDMKNRVYAFAANSTNQSEYCIKLVGQMHFKSDEPSLPVDSENTEIVFYDVEVFPNLFLINWKKKGPNNPIIRMINPTGKDIEPLLKYRLIGFNCRRYDNHMLYGRMLGYNNLDLFNLSQRIINGERNAFFGEAYNLSYTDIYDFASAGNKKSLKKLEIEMGIHHKELGLPWDQPVPEEQWPIVAEYCDNDVIATESAWEYLQADWTAREILADLADLTVNDTTNTLTTKIIFNNDRKPQSQFCYRDMSLPVNHLDPEVEKFLNLACPEMMSKRHGEAKSLLPYFPGYKYENGVSTYLGETVGEGGYVYAEPGVYRQVALLDVASMHPHSIIAECLFGPTFTVRFREIVEGRVDIKHEYWDEVNNILDGKLTPYIQKVINGEMTSKQLANALKTAINSVYGLTAANFDNPFRDNRNKDNIVAKRGALFMINLKHEVQKRGFTVAHIKTDSIKIPNATPEIIQFVMRYGEEYGYTFEHEATYEKMCLVNDAVYIAKYLDKYMAMEEYGYIPDDNRKHSREWTATGTQFQIPYVFKTLFSKEPIAFEDMCETKSVTSSLYLDMNEKLPDVSADEKELAKAEHDLKKGLINESMFNNLKKEYNETISRGHDYRFIGKVGSFCPILPNHGGGLLVREKDGKYYAATGSKGYRWLESELVKNNCGDCIDKEYYNSLVDDAVDSISQYCDFEEFASDDLYSTKVSMPPCGDHKYETCFDCPKFDNNTCQLGYNLDKYICKKGE